MRIGLVGAGRIGAFHAATLRGLAAVEQVVVADADPVRAELLAKELDLEAAAGVRELLGAHLDGLVIATATDSHAALVLAGQEARLPTFCEKPVAGDLAGTATLARLLADSPVPVQVGFQRRFDAGFRRAADAVREGALGRVHTIRACTSDVTPPPADFLRRSGGFFKDCSIHDFDAIRFVTGHEVVSVYAVGANRGEAFVADAGDIDTAGAVLTLDDGTIALVSGSRYNGAGHDVRMEVLGSRDTLAVGLDEHAAVRSAETGVDFPAGPPHRTFMDRFRAAYAAELAAFAEVAAGRAASPCTVEDALRAFAVAQACDVSFAQGRPVRVDEVHQ